MDKPYKNLVRSILCVQALLWTLWIYFLYIFPETIFLEVLFDPSLMFLGFGVVLIPLLNTALSLYLFFLSYKISDDGKEDIRKKQVVIYAAANLSFLVFAIALSILL